MNNNHFNNSIKVLILQTRNVSQKDYRQAAVFIDQQLSIHNQKLSSRNKSTVDFLVLPEDWLADEEFTILPESDEHNRELRSYKDPNKHEVDLELNTCLKEISKVVRKHKTYAKVLGSLHEKTQMNTKGFNTCVVINREGQIICAHRKRRDEDYDFGTEPGVFQTEYGCMAVMICLDVENEDVFVETLSYNPVIMFNPTWIPAKSASTSSSNTRIAMETMSRKFEVICTQHNFTLVRCDTSNNSVDRSFHGESLYGMGTSQVIGPYATVYAPHQGDVSFVVEIDLSFANSFQRITMDPSTSRTDVRDNTGNRYNMSTFIMDDKITCINFLDNNTLLLGTSLGTVGSFHLGTRTSKALCQLKEPIICIQCSKEHNTAFWMTQDLIVKWDLKEGKQVTQITQKSLITCASYLPSEFLFIGNADNRIQAMDFKLESSFEILLEGNAEHINTCKDNNNSFLLVCCGTVKLYQIRGNIADCVWTWKDSVKVIQSFCSLQSIILVTKDELMVLNFPSLELHRIQMDTANLDGSIKDSVFVGKGCYLLGLENGDVVLWNSEQSKILHRFFGSRSIGSMDACGNRLVVVAEGVLLMWEFFQNRVPKQLVELLV